jgi:formylglycine-generating enzyme required for sulfatase activity
MAWIPSGSFLMGSDHHYPEETPAHKVSVDGFWIDRHTVTNDEFARFVRKTDLTVADTRPTRPTTPGPGRSCWSPRPRYFRALPHRMIKDVSVDIGWLGKQLIVGYPIRLSRLVRMSLSALRVVTKVS